MLPYLYTAFMGFVRSVCVCVREREKDLTQMGYNLPITICLEEGLTHILESQVFTSTKWA